MMMQIKSLHQELDKVKDMFRQKGMNPSEQCHTFGEQINPKNLSNQFKRMQNDSNSRTMPNTSLVSIERKVEFPKPASIILHQEQTLGKPSSGTGQSGDYNQIDSKLREYEQMM